MLSDNVWFDLIHYVREVTHKDQECDGKRMSSKNNRNWKKEKNSSCDFVRDTVMLLFLDPHYTCPTFSFHLAMTSPPMPPSHQSVSRPPTHSPEIERVSKKCHVSFSFSSLLSTKRRKSSRKNIDLKIE